MNRQKTKSQHTVPESYLKEFIKDDELFVLNILNLKKGWNEFPRKRSPGGICYIEDYYTIKAEYPENYFDLKKHDTHFVEDGVLTSLENKYPNLFRQLTEQTSLTSADAIDVSDFITTIKLRNPYWFEKVIKKNISGWAEKLLPELIAEKKKEDPNAAQMPDHIFEFIKETLLQRQANDPDYAQQFLLFSLIARYQDNKGQNKRLREKIIDCKWDIYVAPKSGPFFITTDNPGVAIGISDRKYHTIKLDDGFVFYFPLSYQYALVFTDANKDMAFSENNRVKNIHLVNVEAEMVNRINDTLIQVANKLLIAADSPYLDIIALKNKPQNS